MIWRLARNRAFQYVAVVTVVLAGKLLPDAAPRDPATLPVPGTFVVPASAATPDDAPPAAVAVRILRMHTDFPDLGPDGAASAIRAVATTGDGERLAADVRADLEALAAGYPGGPTRFWVGPLGAHEQHVGPGRARVELWFARVVAPPASPVYQEWRIATVELARENGAWRLAGYRDRPGPRPAARPAGSDLVAEAAGIRGFEAVDG